VPHVYHHDSTAGQGINAGEVIAKLAEDAYFMRVDIGRPSYLPSELPKTHTTKLLVAAR
jgi:hypothetical protein